MKRCFLYSRTSTPNQNENNQLRPLKTLVKEKGWETIDAYYDSGCSGFETKRPGLKYMWDLINQQKLDTVIVWKFDRFARDVLFFRRSVKRMHSRGVELYSVNEATGTATKQGLLVATIAVAMAEHESSLISDRIKAGMARAREDGIKIGRPRKLTPAQIQEAMKLMENGMSLRGAARELGVSHSTLGYSIKREQ